ncbi:MAG: cyanophycinase [bacterium]|nr:MAG: cyanophycinase [bacterium]
MKILFLKHNILILLFFLCLVDSCNTVQRDTKGHLVIVGGGIEHTPEILKKFVDLAGGSEARIAIITMASEDYLAAGEYYTMEFKALGAQQAKTFHIKDSIAANSDSVVANLEDYNSFFFGGGDQNRLTKIFLNSEALKVMHRKYSTGSVLGGNSAGAAIMSRIMLTGEGNWTVLSKDSVDLSEGFGFVTEAIIDQHFIERRRFNRLLAATIEFRKTGIGIDQETAVWIKPNSDIEVLGNGVVLVIRPDHAKFPKQFQNGLLNVKNLELDIYRSGEIFRF